MEKNKGTVNVSSLWLEKAHWVAEILNEVEPNPEDKTWSANLLIALRVPCAIMENILRLYGVTYEVDWTK